MKHNLTLLTGALLGAFSAGAFAQTAVTDPVGYITINVKAAGTLSFVAPSLVNKVEFAGTASGATATTISVSGTPFTAGAYNPVGGLNQYYVEITNGSGEGAWTNITGNANNSITVADNMTSVITGGTTTIKIRKHVTIADMFGATNSAGLDGGGQISDADEIKVLNGETKAITSIFYYDDGGPDTAWVDADLNLVANLPIEPQQGLYIQRKLATPLSFVRVGHVKTGKTMLTADPGINILAVARAVGSAFTLANSNLTNAGPQSGKVKGAGQISDADVLKIQQANGSLKEFFFYDDGGPDTAWVDADLNVLPGTQLNEGTSFVFLRQASAGLFTWTVPAETIAP